MEKVMGFGVCLALYLVLQLAHKSIDGFKIAGFWSLWLSEQSNNIFALYISIAHTTVNCPHLFLHIEAAIHPFTSWVRR